MQGVIQWQHQHHFLGGGGGRGKRKFERGQKVKIYVLDIFTISIRHENFPFLNGIPFFFPDPYLWSPSSMWIWNKIWGWGLGGSVIYSTQELKFFSLVFWSTGKCSVSKLLKMHFCKLILPSEKGLPGAPKRLKPRSFGSSTPTKRAPGPHAMRHEVPVAKLPMLAIADWSLLILRLVNIIFTFFLEWAILMPDLCLQLSNVV